MLKRLASFKLEVAKYCVGSLTRCERMHRDVSSQYSNRIVRHRNYFRFNVPQGISDIGFEEWKKIGDIIALTQNYMEHGDMEGWKIIVANLFLNPQHAN